MSNIQTIQTIQNNSLTFNPFQQKKKEGVVFVPGHAREYRADCSKTEYGFNIGGRKKLGDTLEIVVLYPMLFSEISILEYPTQDWVEILFLDKEKAISSLLLKTVSLDNWNAYKMEALVAGINLATVKTVCSFASYISKKYGQFWGVDFELGEKLSEEKQNELKDFFENNAEKLPNSFRVPQILEVYG